MGEGFHPAPFHIEIDLFIPHYIRSRITGNEEADDAARAVAAKEEFRRRVAVIAGTFRTETAGGYESAARRAVDELAGTLLDIGRVEEMKRSIHVKGWPQ